MKTKALLGWSTALCLSASASQAQQPNEIELLKQQLQQSNEKLEKVLQEHRQLVDSINKRLQTLQGQSPATNAQPAVARPTAIPGTEVPPPAAVSAKPWSPSDPIRVGNNQNYLQLSLDALFAAGTSTAEDVEALQLGGHDPKQRGFTLQNLEATFQGAVDPYFRGQASIVFQIDPAGETTLEAEEAYLETVALPWNLQVKAGQYFTEFGRLNPTHPHTWDFVDQPLVNGRFFGEDGLRNPGARISWLVPTPFYSELYLGVQNSQGETATSFRSDHEGELILGRRSEINRVKSIGDMLFAPRYVAAFDLTPAQTLLAGASAAFGPNGSGSSADTQIYGVDFFWKWKPVNHHGGFPFVTWQTEAMLRRFEAARFVGDVDDDGVNDSVPRERLLDYGVYSQLAYGFRKGWVTAIRGDYVTSDRAEYERAFDRDRDRATRWRLSPNLTYYPSEFSKLRLQYNYDDRGGFGIDHSVWFQFEFLLGAHAAHKF